MWPLLAALSYNYVKTRHASVTSVLRCSYNGRSRHKGLETRGNIFTSRYVTITTAEHRSVVNCHCCSDHQSTWSPLLVKKTFDPRCLCIWYCPCPCRYASVCLSVHKYQCSVIVFDLSDRCLWIINGRLAADLLVALCFCAFFVLMFLTYCSEPFFKIWINTTVGTRWSQTVFFFNDWLIIYLDANGFTMNLMFRKNFRAEKSFGGGGGKHGGKGNPGRNMGKRSREHGYAGVEEHHYRTHIFFSPARSSFQPEYEGWILFTNTKILILL